MIFLLFILIALFYGPAHAETCLESRAPESYTSRSCWDRGSSDPVEVAGVYISESTIDSIIWMSEFSPLLRSGSAERLALDNIKRYLILNRGGYAMLRLRNLSEDDFVEDDCSIMSVQNDRPDKPSDIFISPHQLRDANKSCEDIKIFIAFFLNNVASTESIRVELRKAGLQLGADSLLSWPIIWLASQSGFKVTESLRGEWAPNLNVTAIGPEQIGESIRFANLGRALSGEHVALYYASKTSAPGAVLAELGEYSSIPAFSGYSSTDYLAIHNFRQGFDHVAGELAELNFIDIEKLGEEITEVGGDEGFIIGVKLSDLEDFIELYRDDLIRFGLIQ